MPKSDQGVSADRYAVIPRTLIFITRGDEVLLLKGAPTKRLWANRYNGIGGHIERGEDVLTAARRELREEAGLTVKDLRVVGTVIVDASDAKGICIFVMKGEHASGVPVPSDEGELEWLDWRELDRYPAVEDIQIFLRRVMPEAPGKAPFSARSYYDEQDQLRVDFAD